MEMQMQNAARKLLFSNEEDSGDEAAHHHLTHARSSADGEYSPQSTRRPRADPTASQHHALYFASPTKRYPFERDGILDGLANTTATCKNDDTKILMSDERVLVGQTEVESLADFLASSSSVSPLEVEPCTLGSRRESLQSLPRRSQIAAAFRSMSSAPVAFSKTTGLPLNSSPAPLTRNERSFADKRQHALHSISTSVADDDSGASDNERVCTARSAPTSSGLLCNFEESALNGRLEPLAALDGFRLQIAASGSFCPPHTTLPVTTFFFNLSDDDAPSPYLTLFNPQGTVVRMFVVRFDVSEMPASSQTFLRQRTFFMPAGCPIERAQRSWLRYLIHLRLATDRRGRLYVHTDIRMLFSQKGDLEALNIELEKESQQQYELLSFTEMPQKPRFSPRK
ncbi:Uncharacterized protein Tcan_13919 [Toxocara canis]|uniref:Atos-like conserved domain-containing protein n=1 Tax=Toxocara canis TaxID=6265 RepID=A0A0B2VV39_TOXCA|nr:Uncharacterized protein Tcan_13919 [Toxocara canis]